MPKDIMDFLGEKRQERAYTIDQLFSQGSGYGLIAGRTGLGKTNLLLNLGFRLALGLHFFGLAIKKCKVGYFAFEGSEDNLRDRSYKILMRGLVPDEGWLQVDRIDSFILLSKSGRDKFRDMLRPFDVIMLDPIKWMVGEGYTEPKRVAEFTKAVVEIMRDENKFAIFSAQIRKRDPRVKIEPGELFELKGAADYVEDATFALLLERSELRGQKVPQAMKDRHLTLYFAKHREATRDLSPIELLYDYDKCEFEVV